MSEGEYTPDTGQVRGHYAADERLGGEHNPEYAAEFDRWLNRVRAEVFDQGAHIAFQHVDSRGEIACTNPYRNGGNG